MGKLLLNKIGLITKRALNILAESGRAASYALKH
ncbi:hypothetical protein T190607A01A_10495 [Tenacibaculum sp. 190524A05c]|uniref:Uncharacterized protein n=1 Tax=Tenacibaculum platacis TaxID=3137852 RepID=A0ABM9NSF9_9FLAO